VLHPASRNGSGWSLSGLLAGFAALFVTMHANRRRWLAQG